MMMTNVMQQSADSSCASVSAAHEQFGQELLLAESPPLLPHHMPNPSPQNLVSALPFFNLMIPVADNFGGPVNVSVSPSVDPSGADLPMSGNLRHQVIVYIDCGHTYIVPAHTLLDCNALLLSCV